MTTIIDGSAIAKNIQENLKAKISELKTLGIQPCLVVILVGENPASKIYVRNKQLRAEEAGIHSYTITMPVETTEEELVTKINELNSNVSVNGILVQLPIPAHINSSRIINLIDPKKDVDCFHMHNFGALALGANAVLKPCTPSGCLYLIKTVQKNLSGMHATVVGRSNIVGKPISYMLLAENCTVTIVHSHTRNLPEILKQSDIIIAAIGKPQFIKKEWVKSGAIVIDVGINRLESGKIVGDVDFYGVSTITKAITPVPKGVGPMTIAFLLVNTILATCIQNNLSAFDI